MNNPNESRCFDDKYECILTGYCDICRNEEYSIHRYFKDYWWNPLCDGGPESIVFMDREYTDLEIIDLQEELETMEERIIVNKLRYYYPGKLDNKEPIDDLNYEHFELRYLQLCFILKNPNELVHTMYLNKITYPNRPELGDKVWSIPEHLNGKGMLEVDFNHPKVKKILLSTKPFP